MDNQFSKLEQSSKNLKKKNHIIFMQLLVSFTKLSNLLNFLKKQGLEHEESFKIFKQNS